MNARVTDTDSSNTLDVSTELSKKIQILAKKDDGNEPNGFNSRSKDSF